MAERVSTPVDVHQTDDSDGGAEIYGAVLFQGKMVPRNSEEAMNPQLVRDRVVAEDFVELMARLDTEADQDALPEVDDKIRTALGIKALPDEVVAEL